MPNSWADDSDLKPKTSRTQQPASRVQAKQERKSATTIPKIKSTTAAILREDALLQKQRKQAQDVLENAAAGLIDPDKLQEKMRRDQEEYARMEQERKERAHLSVLLGHEEAFLAKQELVLVKRYVIITFS